MCEKAIHPTDLMGKSILDAREERAELQAKLLKQYGKPLLVHRVNMPGAQKDTPLSQRIFKALEAELMMWADAKAVYKKQFLSAEGPILIRVMDMNAQELKALAVGVEDEHPLGRYVDLDVYAVSGESLSRTGLGHGPRLCYLCGNPAHLCVRSAAHSHEELLHKMEEGYDSR